MKKSDADIQNDVLRELEWDVLVPDAQIRSTVSGGEVILQGTVESGQQREDAEKAVRNLAGVTCVLNRIQVRAGS